MLLRMLPALAIVTMIGNVALSEQSDAPASTGGCNISVELTGDLAKEYARRTGSPHGDEDGLQIQTSGRIVQQLDDGRLRVEHTSHIIREDGITRLITLTATVAPEKITTHVTPTGTSASASPAANSVLTTKETQMRRLKLSDLNNVKLRTWTLSDEIGD